MRFPETTTTKTTQRGTRPAGASFRRDNLRGRALLTVAEAHPNLEGSSQSSRSKSWTATTSEQEEGSTRRRASTRRTTTQSPPAGGTSAACGRASKLPSHPSMALLEALFRSFD
ncbi:hypothetical protein ACHAWF_001191 [Thalassiosira exigua]